MLTRSKLGWIALLLSLEFLLIAHSLGPRISWDALRDDTFSQILVDTNFDFAAFGEQARMPEPKAQPYFDRETTPQTQSPWQYIVWISIIAVAKLIMGQAWVYGIVTLNALAITLSAILIMRLAACFKYGPIVVGALYALFWDQLYFVPWIQSDPIFNLMAAAMLTACASLASANSTQAWTTRCFVLLGFALLATFFRPNGFVLLSFGVLAILYIRFLMQGKLFEFRYARLWWMAGILLTSSVGLLTLAVFAHDPVLWPLDIGRSTIASMHLRTGAGEVVISRPETFIELPESWLDVAAIHYIKFVYFFAFIGQDFSLFHKVANTLWYIPFYCLVLRGILFVLFAHEGTSAPLSHLGVLAITMIILFASFHAVTLVDFEWRYRVAAYPALILLATIGLRRLILDWQRYFFAST